MKILPSFILSLMLLGIWSCSDAGDIVNNDCSLETDCAGVCGGEAVIDCAGSCGGGAIEEGINCTNISYSDHIQPIFNAHCISCHGLSGGLTLTSFENLMNGEVVIPGSGSESLLIEKLMGTAAAGVQMPRNSTPLNSVTISLIETWINEGTLDN